MDSDFNGVDVRAVPIGSGWRAFRYDDLDLGVYFAYEGSSESKRVGKLKVVGSYPSTGRGLFGVAVPVSDTSPGDA